MWHVSRTLSHARGTRIAGLLTASVRHSSAAGAHDPAATTTHFGYATVDASDKQRLVGDVFRRVAESYDVMNDVMSAGLHRLWKDEFVRMAGNFVSSGDRETVVLDVAGGTGDIAFRLYDAARNSFVHRSPSTPPPRIIVMDINPAMLGVGRERAAALGLANSAPTPAAAGAPWTSARPVLEWAEGNAEALTAIPSASVDLYTIAFGIRNVTNVDAALREAFRVLRPGGRFMCLEFSRVDVPIVGTLYDTYSFAAIPALGEVFAGDRASYQYLVESIRRFPPQAEFGEMIVRAGFSAVEHTNFAAGVCAVHSGFKLTQ